jgi:hypothetical protein
VRAVHPGVPSRLGSYRRTVILTRMFCTIALVVCVLPASHSAAAAPSGPTTSPLSIIASQDVTVRADKPGLSYGSRKILEVDGDPVRQTFLKFEVAGVGSSEVGRVRLRMHQVDSSRVGGRVFVSSTAWTESTTWNTRPTIDGPQLGQFGSVASGSWYEIDLPASSITGDGSISLAVDSPISDGADWSSRESGNAPTLLIDLVAAEEPPAEPSLTTVAGSSMGSSDPTFYGNGHRLGRTAGGRLLTVHGRHGTGVQLAWKDPGGRDWSQATTGHISDGLLLSGTGSGDWPASVTIARESSGRETALIVWGGQNFGAARPLQMRALTNLDSPGGPQVGPMVTLAAPPLGAARPDIGIEAGPNGDLRALVTWTERTSDSSIALMVGWLDDYLASEPNLVSRTPLLTDGSASKSGTVAATPQGARVAARTNGGRLRVFGHDRSAGLSDWWSSAAGPITPTGAYPSAVGLKSGQVLVTASGDISRGIITVQRFTGPGQIPTPELEIEGYAHPTIASDSSGLRLVAIRLADGFVISRSGTTDGVWETSDRVAIAAEGGGNHSWPHALGSQAGGLTLVVRGPGTTVNRSSVLAYEEDPRRS